MFLQRRHRRLRAQKRTIQIGRHHAFPGGKITVFNRAELRHAGIIDQRIQTTKARQNCRNHRLHLHLITDITVKTLCFSPKIPAGQIQFRLIPVNQRHRPAFGQKLLGGRQPDPARRAGHHCHFAHQTLPRFHATLPAPRLTRNPVKPRLSSFPKYSGVRRRAPRGKAPPAPPATRPPPPKRKRPRHCPGRDPSSQSVRGWLSQPAPGPRRSMRFLQQRFPVRPNREPSFRRSTGRTLYGWCLRLLRQGWWRP